MSLNKILHKNYMLTRAFYQFKLPSNIDYIILNDDPVRLLSQFIEEMNLSDLYATYSRIRNNTVSDPLLEFTNIATDYRFQNISVNLALNLSSKKYNENGKPL